MNPTITSAGSEVHVFEKPHAFYPVFERKGGPDPESTHYCPGCGHGTLHKLIAEALDDFGVADRTIFVSPVGCSVFAYYYFDVGNVQAAHGRAPAVATGIKRARPESIVIAYQGDGDLAAIGLNNILQAANRGELVTVFFVNNALYGMTGGQMAPTTLLGQRTTTTPQGRNPDNEGYPLHMCELLATLEAPAFIQRVAVGEPKQVMKARKAVRRALECQIEGKGFAFVECLAQCPTGWKMSPESSVEWLMKSLTETFPLRVFRDEVDSRPARRPGLRPAEPREIAALVHPAAAERSARQAPSWEGEIRLKAAGFGGQGVLYLGEKLAAAGMEAGDEVSWLPSYGPEMRGGTAHCHVILSSKPIGSPLVEQATHLVAMNAPSLARFESEVAIGGTILFDSSLIESEPARSDVVSIPVPATKIADGLGSAKVANMVLLGALLVTTDHPTPETVEKVLAGHGKPELAALNRKALAAGAELAMAAAAYDTPWAV
jgi:2-oxoisovalerate ferredoxin oxidoreductase beta subunit